MPKVTNPLFSGDARGKFGEKLIFTRGGVVRRYFKPRNPNTAAQQAQREAFKEFTVPYLTQEQADLLYSAILHMHDEAYSPIGHRHDGDYLRVADQARFVGFVSECYGYAGNNIEQELSTWTGLASGAKTNLLDELHHPGIHRVGTSSTANSGAYVRYRDANKMIFQGGETLEMIFRLPSLTDVKNRLGFHDSSAIQTDPTDGAWLDIDAGTLTGKTALGGSISTTAGSYSMASGTWYKGRISVNDAIDLVTFRLYESPGSTVLWEGTINTNIPTDGANAFHLTLLAGKTSGGAANVFDVDWIKFEIGKALTR